MDKPFEQTTEHSLLAAIQFTGYYFKKMTFELNESYDQSEVNIKFDIDFKVSFDKENQTALLALLCTVFPEEEAVSYPFRLYAEMLANFTYSETLTDEKLYSMVTENGIAIMFPYIRSAISNICVNAGVNPLVLPTINVVEFVKSKSS